FKWPGGDATLGADLARIGREAEAAGFYSLWVMDHFFQIRGLGPPEDPMLEGYSALSYMAGVTSKVKLGTMVTGVTYRYPGLLVKTATTLDVVSGGRAYFGVGAAWNEEEHKGLDVPFPPLKERFERLEELLQIAHQMWDGQDAPYDGTHYHLTRTLNAPQAVSKPHPPILIGGTGEQKTLRFVAKYGDACNLFLRLGDEEVRRKLEVLRGHCADLNRPYTDIEKTSLDRLVVATDGRENAVSGQQLVDYFGRAADLGFDQAIVSVANVVEPGVFDLFAQVQSEIAAIPEGGRR
ncbi:MAG TPA: LLM class F420-dependent oxidoreductase, partial [Chloroflexia bacterium]|nr:LLM class F420-dependent oxidoreductase [Chloroflexia bacterium]